MWLLFYELQIMELYIARDKDGSLWVYDTEPQRQDDDFRVNYHGQQMFIDCSMFPEVTWENSPQRLTIASIDVLPWFCISKSSLN